MKKHILILSLIPVIMLLWALNPNNPYAYYILLRWVCCGIFAYLAFQAFAEKRQGLVWLLGITALLYNPVFPVHLNRALWSIVNVITVIIIITSIVVEYKYIKKKNEILLTASTLLNDSQRRNEMTEPIDAEFKEVPQNNVLPECSECNVNTEQPRKSKWKDVASSAGVILLIIFFIAGGFALLALLISGVGWVSEKIYPLTIILSQIALFAIIPISLLLIIFKKTRGFGAIGLLMSSYLLGISLWVWSLIIAYTLAGTFWLVVGLILGGIGIVPIAFIAALFSAKWFIVLQIGISAIVIYAVRAFSIFLADRS